MTRKTKRIINITFSAVLLAALLLAFCWFSVSGSELAFLQQIPSDCTASVTIDVGMGGERQEFDLTADQLSQLLDLIQSTSYWRDPASSITHNEQTTYFIFVTFEEDSTTHYISITSSGDYALNIYGSQEIPFKNHFLRIRNKEWTAKLEAILMS